MSMVSFSPLYDRLRHSHSQSQSQSQSHSRSPAAAGSIPLPLQLQLHLFILFGLLLFCALPLSTSLANAEPAAEATHTPASSASASVRLHAYSLSFRSGLLSSSWIRQRQSMSNTESLSLAFLRAFPRLKPDTSKGFSRLPKVPINNNATDFDSFRAGLDPILRDYVRGFSVLIGFGVFYGLLTLACWLTFCVCRCSRDSCGGRQSGMNFSDKQVLTGSILGGLLIASLGTGTAFLWSANIDVITGIDSLFAASDVFVNYCYDFIALTSNAYDAAATAVAAADELSVRLAASVPSPLSAKLFSAALGDQTLNGGFDSALNYSLAAINNQLIAAVKLNNQLNFTTIFINSLIAIQSFDSSARSLGLVNSMSAFNSQLNSSFSPPNFFVSTFSPYESFISFLRFANSTRFICSSRIQNVTQEHQISLVNDYNPISLYLQDFVELLTTSPTVDEIINSMRTGQPQLTASALQAFNDTLATQQEIATSLIPLITNFNSSVMRIRSQIDSLQSDLIPLSELLSRFPSIPTLLSSLRSFNSTGISNLRNYLNLTISRYSALNQTAAASFNRTAIALLNSTLASGPIAVSNSMTLLVNSYSASPSLISQLAQFDLLVANFSSLQQLCNQFILLNQTIVLPPSFASLSAKFTGLSARVSLVDSLLGYSSALKNASNSLSDLISAIPNVRPAINLLNNIQAILNGLNYSLITDFLSFNQTLSSAPPSVTNFLAFISSRQFTGVINSSSVNSAANSISSSLTLLDSFQSELTTISSLIPPVSSSLTQFSTQIRVSSVYSLISTAILQLPTLNSSLSTQLLQSLQSISSIPLFVAINFLTESLPDYYLNIGDLANSLSTSAAVSDSFVVSMRRILLAPPFPVADAAIIDSYINSTRSSWSAVSSSFDRFISSTSQNPVFQLSQLFVSLTSLISVRSRVPIIFSNYSVQIRQLNQSNFDFSVSFRQNFPSTFPVAFNLSAAVYNDTNKLLSAFASYEDANSPFSPPNFALLGDRGRSLMTDLNSALNWMYKTKRSYEYSRNLFSDTMNNYETSLLMTAELIILIPFAFSCLLLIAIAFRQPCPSMVFGLLMFPTTAFIAGLFALVAVPAFIVSDQCDSPLSVIKTQTADRYLNRDLMGDFFKLSANVELTPAVDYFAGCAGAEPELVHRLSQSEEVLAANGLNFSLIFDDFQSQFPYSLSPAFSSSLMSTRDSLRSQTNKLFIQAARDLNCTRTSVVYNTLISAVCNDFGPPVALICCLLILTSLCTCPGIILGVKGFKLFHSQNFITNQIKPSSPPHLNLPPAYIDPKEFGK